MNLFVLELLHKTNSTTKEIWLKEILSDDFYLSRLKREITIKNNQINKTILKKMLNYYGVETSNLYKAFECLPVQPQIMINKKYDDKALSQLLFLSKKLSHTRNLHKIYTLLYDYFVKIDNPINRKWAIDFFCNKNKIQKILEVKNE